jgi:Rieske Fe-S protein
VSNQVSCVLVAPGMEQTTVDVQPAATSAAPPPSRRRVLAIVAVTGAGGALLAACGGGGDDTTTTPGGSGSDSASPTDAASSPAGGALVDTAKVPVGGGVILEQQKIVVTQPSAGTFKAFSAICTHQACTVGSVKDGVISCPCHGSAYSAADGSVENGPATRALAPVAVTVEGGKVVQS